MDYIARQVGNIDPKSNKQEKKNKTSQSCLPRMNDSSVNVLIKAF